MFIRARLYVWYKRERLANDDDRVYQIDKLTLGMLGPPGNPLFKSKAAEARTMLRFTAELFSEFSHHFGVQGLTQTKNTTSIR
jgi:hypothetical protein